MKFDPLTLLNGDALSMLKNLPTGSAQMCVTSPPYWGLRDYNLEPTVWGGLHSCHHDWKVHLQPSANGQTTHEMVAGTRNESSATRKPHVSNYCKCGAWRGCLGLEPTPDLFIEHLVEIFREVRRVLRSDGTLWVNIGDSYAADRGYQVPDNKHRDVGNSKGMRSRDFGLKPKDLVGIPWMLAFALRTDGWYLRADVIWDKPNPMPESVTDRPSKSHEYIFLLAPSAEYFYDHEAIKETPQSNASDLRKMAEQKPRIGGKTLTADDPLYKANSSTNIGKKRGVGDPSGRNKRSVWTITTVPFPGSHFAVFPPELPRICILAGSSARGACPSCSAPWSRVVEKNNPSNTGTTNSQNPTGSTANRLARLRQAAREQGEEFVNRTQTLGWRPGCSCYELPIIEDYPSSPVQKEQETDIAFAKRIEEWRTKTLEPWRRQWEDLKPRYEAQVTIPCVVLDHHAGSGTTGKVAIELGRSAILIEPNNEYVQMINERCTTTLGLPLL